MCFAQSKIWLLTKSAPAGFAVLRSTSQPKRRILDRVFDGIVKRQDDPVIRLVALPSVALVRRSGVFRSTVFS